jgi:tRNA splicing endonuclease
LYKPENLLAMNEKTLVEQFQEILQKEREKRQEKKPNDLLRAYELYHDLLKRGWIKKRGYTLRGIEDVHVPLMPIRRNL